MNADQPRASSKILLRKTQSVVNVGGEWGRPNVGTPVPSTRAMNRDDPRGSSLQAPASIVGLEAADLAVKADLDLGAVEIEVVDAKGAGFAFLLGRPSALDLIMHLIGALSKLEVTPEDGAAETFPDRPVCS